MTKQQKKIVAWLLSGVVLLVLLGSADTGKNVKNNDPIGHSDTVQTTVASYTLSDWSGQFRVTWETFMGHWNALAADFSSADLVAITDECVNLHKDAANLELLTNSPDAQLNAGVHKLSVDVADYAVKALLFSNEITDSNLALATQASDAVGADTAVILARLKALK